MKAISAAAVATVYRLDDEQFSEVERLDRPEPVRLPWQKRTFDVVFAVLALSSLCRCRC
jgi:hypothetical protein